MLKSVTKKQLQILVILFVFRGMLFSQLTRELARRMDRPSTETFSQNTYPDIRDLEKTMKLVVREEVVLDGRLHHFTYLTKQGLELVGHHLDILPGYRGTGFNNDYGDFTYELHRPPQSNVAHQILQTDMYMSLGLLANEYPIKCRDNRYCSVPYVWEGKEHKFRPDGEIMINGKVYLLEADRGTMDTNDLLAKFEGYNRYFKWLRQNGRPIPAGVIVVYQPKKITGVGFKRRWSTFLNAFMSKMSEWYLEFNLSFVLLDDLEKVIVRELYPEHQRTSALKIMPAYEDKERGVGPLVFWPQDVKGNFLNSTPLSITEKADGSQKIHVYERFEHAESRAIVRIFQMYRFMIEKPQYKVASFVPIFYYSDGDVMPTYFNGFDEADELNTLFRPALWLRVKDGFPHWSDSKGNHHNVGNPLR